VSDVWIVYNTFRLVRLETVAAKAQGDVSGIVIAYNHQYSEPMSVRNTPDAIVSPVRHNWYVIGNVSDTEFGSPHGMLWITNTHTVVVRDNFMPLQAGRGQIAVQSTGSTNVQVFGNSFPPDLSGDWRTSTQLGVDVRPPLSVTRCMTRRSSP